MKRRAYALTLASLVGLLGCGGGNETATTGSTTGDTGGGNGATGGGGAATTTGSTSASGGQGGGNTCNAELDGECGACMKDTCCTALSDCEADANCLACVTGVDGTVCESSDATHERVNAFLTCKGGPCQTACIGGPMEGCEGALTDLVAAECQECLEASCCSEVAACNANEGCWQGCVVDFSEESCHANPDGHALFHALNQCTATSCSAACSGRTVEPSCDAPAMAPSAGSCIAITGTVECNPVTNEGCADPGAACDTASGGAFVCYGPPNEQAICDACGESEGFCAPGHICAGGTCARYCCDDGDCGTGVCDKTLLENGSVGVCLKKP